MISSFEPFVILFVILVIVFPIIYLRFKYTHRHLAALESIADILRKIAEKSGK